MGTVEQQICQLSRDGSRNFDDRLFGSRLWVRPKQIRTKTGQLPIQRHRLTAFDALWYNARLALFVTIIAAVFTTSLGAYRLWKEFKR